MASASAVVVATTSLLLGLMNTCRSTSVALSHIDLQVSPTTGWTREEFQIQTM